MCLQMESHIHEKLLNDFNWLGVWISSRVVNWSEYHFYTMKSTFSRFLLPCTRLFQFRVGFTSMLRQCTVTVWAVFAAADAAVFCAFALLIMTCNIFFVLAFFNYLAQSVGLSIIFQCVFKYLGFSVDTSINKWYSFGVSHSQMHFSITRCSKSIGTKQNNLLLKLHVFMIFLPLGKSDWSQLWRRQYN